MFAVGIYRKIGNEWSLDNLVHYGYDLAEQVALHDTLEEAIAHIRSDCNCPNSNSWKWEPVDLVPTPT